MAIFSRKPEAKKEVQPAAAGDQPKADTDANAPAVTVNTNPVIVGGRGNQALVFPRLSEKASFLTRFNQYVFKIEGKANKVELRKAIEKAYGVKIAAINIVKVKGKVRRYGRTTGKMSDFKKAIVTLQPNSKKIDLIES